MVLFSGMWQQSAQAAGEGFTVKAELPENQRDTSASYFDLRVSPNQAQTLNVVIQNHLSFFGLLLFALNVLVFDNAQ